MSIESYDKAHKLALKQFRSDSSKGIYPYLQVLDEILSYTNTAAEIELGLTDIPLELIAGTKSAGRTNAFASNFMPLLPDHSEFAIKWSSLYDTHIREGIRDPVIVYEFMNRFYVAEGNKRVSILKYCDAVTVSAYVTRIIPQKNNSKEAKVYYEYLDFYKLTQVNYLYFTQPGSYKKLLRITGKAPEHIWTEEEKEDFHSAFYRFLEAFEKGGGKKLSLSSGDAFLVYLDLYGYEDFLQKSFREIQKEVEKIWHLFLVFPNKPEIKLVMNSKELPDKKTLLGRILPQNVLPLKIAFIHCKTKTTSTWTYGHELGRAHIEKVFGQQIHVETYFGADSKEKAKECFEQAISHDCSIIFTTSPRLLPASLQYAAKYPKLKILNCSLNSNCGHLRTYYGRLYEAKFLIGVIAGIMAQTSHIGYIADYPIYGMIANINAFALGAQMVNPDAKIHLEWSTRQNFSPDSILNNTDISFVSGQDLIIPDKETKQFGLYQTGNSDPDHLAMAVWNWGSFYEKVIRSILNGTWKQKPQMDKDSSINYWWGMSSGMIDVLYSSRIPSGTRQLLNLLKKSICSEDFHPFAGTIFSQDGLVHKSDADSITPDQIITMDWLAENIIGSIPSIEELTKDAQSVVLLQGVTKTMKGTDTE